MSQQFFCVPCSSSEQSFFWRAIWIHGQITWHPKELYCNVRRCTENSIQNNSSRRTWTQQNNDEIAGKFIDEQCYTIETIHGADSMNVYDIPISFTCSDIIRKCSNFVRLQHSRSFAQRLLECRVIPLCELSERKCCNIFGVVRMELFRCWSLWMRSGK